MQEREAEIRDKIRQAREDKEKCERQAGYKRACINGETKESQEIAHFSTGATRGSADGKGRFDLIPYCALRRVALRYEEGAKVHGDETWKRGIPLSSFFSSASRHLAQAIDGQDDEDHLAAVLWNVMGAMWTMENFTEEQLKQMEGIKK